MPLLVRRVRAGRRGAPAVVALAVVGLVTVAVGGCATSPTGGPESVSLPDGSTALRWGSGDYGVILVTGEGEQPADWGSLAEAIGANRMTALAVDTADQSPERLAAAADWLAGTGVERIAFVSSGARGAGLLVTDAGSGATQDQLIVISGALTDTDLATLGEVPKLFVAAEGDTGGADAATHMASVAGGTWNELLLVRGAESGLTILEGDGATELIDGVVARLEERR